MNEIETGLQDITAIRAMMERATKFLSLSGLSGVSAGIVALAGAWAAHAAITASGAHIPLPGEAPSGDASLEGFLVGDALAVLLLALACSTWFSVRMARRKDAPLWGPTTAYMLAALLIPLAAGGAFCGILLHHGIFGLIPAVMLVFYGLALLSASNFTFNEIRYLGAIEVLLGLTAGFHPAIALFLWAGGFGILHIVYGILLYARYER